MSRITDVLAELSQLGAVDTKAVPNRAKIAILPPVENEPAPEPNPEPPPTDADADIAALTEGFRNGFDKSAELDDEEDLEESADEDEEESDDEESDEDGDAEESEDSIEEASPSTVWVKGTDVPRLHKQPSTPSLRGALSEALNRLETLEAVVADLRSTLETLLENAGEEV